MRIIFWRIDEVGGGRKQNCGRRCWCCREGRGESRRVINCGYINKII